MPDERKINIHSASRSNGKTEKQDKETNLKKMVSCYGDKIVEAEATNARVDTILQNGKHENFP